MSTKHGYEGRPNYFCAVRGGEVTLFLCCKVACSAQATVETTVGKKNAAWKVRQGISQWLWFNYSLDMKMFGNWLMDLQLISLNKKKTTKTHTERKGEKKYRLLCEEFLKALMCCFSPWESFLSSPVLTCIGWNCLSWRCATGWHLVALHLVQVIHP